MTIRIAGSLALLAALAGCARDDAALVALESRTASAGPVAVAHAAGNGPLRLRVELPAEQDGGRYRLARLTGSEMFKFAAELAPLEHDGRRWVELRLPAASLPPGPHRVLLIDAASGAALAEWSLEVAGPGP